MGMTDADVIIGSTVSRHSHIESIHRPHTRFVVGGIRIRGRNPSLRKHQMCRR